MIFRIKKFVFEKLIVGKNHVNLYAFQNAKHNLL